MPAGSVLVWMSGLYTRGGRESIGSMALRLVSVLLPRLAAPGREPVYRRSSRTRADTAKGALCELVGYKMHQGLGFADPGGLKS
jgi:hypothetical protein